MFNTIIISNKFILWSQNIQITRIELITNYSLLLAAVCILECNTPFKDDYEIYGTGGIRT